MNILTDSAKRHGIVPMFTLSEMAARGEANVNALVVLGRNQSDEANFRDHLAWGEAVSVAMDKAMLW